MQANFFVDVKIISKQNERNIVLNLGKMLQVSKC